VPQEQGPADASALAEVGGTATSASYDITRNARVRGKALRLQAGAPGSERKRWKLRVRTGASTRNAPSASGRVWTAVPALVSLSVPLTARQFGVLRLVDGRLARQTAMRKTLLLQTTAFWLYGAAQESNLPSLGLPDLTGFEGLLSDVQLATEAGFSLRFRPVRSSWVR
jgi:hypothetical protein